MSAWPSSATTGTRRTARASRDYIHVLDLAEGHLAALEHLDDGCEAFNLGTGTGVSVLDVIETTEKVSGRSVPYEVVGRRDGDIATSLADPSKANKQLEWRADRNMEAMLRDAWNWQSRYPNGYADKRGAEPAPRGES